MNLSNNFNNYPPARMPFKIVGKMRVRFKKPVALLPREIEFEPMPPARMKPWQFALLCGSWLLLGAAVYGVLEVLK